MNLSRTRASALFALSNAVLLSVSLLTMTFPAAAAAAPSLPSIVAQSASTTTSTTTDSTTTESENTNGPTDSNAGDPSVTTDAATGVTGNDATLNATVGPVDADNTSFWVSTTAGIDVSSPTIPSGVYSTQVLGAVAAGDFFTAPLSSVTTDGIPGNMPAITPDTDYYYVAWAHTPAGWVHGGEQHIHTASAENTPSCTIVSDTKTLLVDDSPSTVPHYAVVVSHIHSAWTHLLDTVGAKWIWGEDPVADTTVDETETFTRTFSLENAATAATLDIAADNGYKVSVNGTQVVDLLDTENNYSATTTYNLLPYLNQGNNTITFTVKNIGVPGSNEDTNPAGLDYAVQVTGTNCGPAVSTPPQKTDVTVCKEDENGNKLSGWQLTLRKANAIGSVDVSATDGNGVEQTIPNVGPGHYVARATGVYTYRADPVASTSDAAYSYRLESDGYTGPYFPWIRENDFNDPYKGYLGVMINDQITDWGSIFNPNPSHKYWTNIPLATTTSLNFDIKDDNFGDNSGSLHVDVFNGFTGVTDESGCTTFKDVPYGAYELHEIHKQGWTRIDDNRHVTVNGDSNHFTVVNDDGKGPHITVVATKIVCDSETDLPNLGGESHVTDENTAKEFVAAHPDCHLEPGWQFQWGNQDAGYKGGTYVGEDPAYHTFGATDENGVATTSINLNGSTVNPGKITEVHLREVLQDGYIPFSDGNGDTPDVSAEFYCSDDGLHYDNWDFIRNPQDGHTYYCVAFNAPGENGGGGNGGATLTVVKNTTGGDGAFTFKLTDEDQGDGGTSQNVDVNTTEGTGSKDVDLNAGDEYNIDEIVPEGWHLTGESCTNGNDLAGQKAISDDDITFTPGEGDHITCTFSNTNETNNVNNTIVVHNEDLATDLADVLADPTKWYFYNDDTNAIQPDLGTFVTGPATPPLGTGSVEMQLGADPDSRKNIATSEYGGTLLSDITSFGYSGYSNPNDSGSGPNDTPYFGFAVDFTGSGTYQSRLTYDPSVNQPSVPQNTWNTFDMIDGGNALWSWNGYADNGNKWPDGNTSEYRTWDDILSAFPDAQMSSTTPYMGVRVGLPGPDGYIGDVDKFVIGVTDGSTNTTNTYDFEPTAESGGDGGNGGSGGSSGHHTSGSGGSVLGASTGPGQVLGATCEPLLTTFLKMGWPNLADEVTKLQNFLNSNMNAGLTVSGMFDSSTDAAVRNFQIANGSDVLKPWVGVANSGISSPTDATGFVYKTTQWKINMINCPDLNLTFPTLDTLPYVSPS